MKLSRRAFITSAALAPVACGVPLSYERGMPVAQPTPLPLVRPPQPGQEWSYIKRNVFNGKNLGLVTDRITSIGSTIVLERTDENGGKLPNEVQAPWGMVITDPHWSHVINFDPAIPLWPQELSASWNKQVITKYTLAGYPENPSKWQLYMSAHGWEQITVPAGSFITLRYQNLINYDSNDDNKVDCIRKETIWFAPSIGRWVAQESSGSYQIRGEVGALLLEDSLQWQLTSYK
jgi:hypothetical protein